MSEIVRSYPSHVRPLQLLHDAYFGTGGFRNGVYLVRHRREHEDSFEERKGVSYYLNYLRPCLDSHVDPIFRQGAERTAEGAGSNFWLLFRDDADRGGRSLDDLLSMGARNGQLYGVHFLVVTAPADAPTTLAEQPDKRPWAFDVFARDVTEVQRDKFGRIVLLRYEETNEDGKRQERELTASGWTIYDDHGDPIDGGQWERPRETAPVVALIAGEWLGDKLPEPRWYDAARVSARIFNLCSELDEVLRNQTFSILSYPARDLKGLVIGTNNALGYDPKDGGEPKFLAPPSGPAEVIMKRIDQLVREIYRMALLSHQTGSEEGKDQRSGIALRVDREALDSALAKSARKLEEAELAMAELFSWWTGLELTVTVQRPRDFAMADVLTELQPILETLQTLAADIPAGLKEGLWLRIARILLPEADLTELEAELEERAKARETNRAIGGAGDGDDVIPGASGDA